MILVSSRISSEELLDLKDDISFLFPKYAITSIDSPNIRFQVVSIQEYPLIVDNSVPILTPISIHQLRDKNINISKFTFPQYGYINLHLYKKKIAFSGFGSTKQRLKDMCSRMGAIVERAISPNTSILVSKTLRSEMAQAALKFNVPIVQDQFISDLFQSPIILNEDDYKLKLFSGLVFTSSCCSKKEKESISNYIVQNGGTFLNGLYSNTSIVVSKSNANSYKLKEAIDMRKTIITDNLKEVYSTPENLRVDTLPLLIPSDLFNNLYFYISPKLERCYKEFFLELKILIRQHGGKIIDSIDSASYIIQMDTDKDNCIERQSQSYNDKRKLSTNDNNNNIPTNSIVTSSSNSTSRDSRFRTPIWIERSVEEGQLLDPSDFPLYSPTRLTKRNGNFYVSLTGFNGKEYLNLISTLKWLGIRYSTRFKKSMTHLIAKENHISKKTQTAAEWDIPVVGVDWIFSIAEGNLTNEALSNPWSPRRIHKVSPPISTSKNTFNLNISDDDDVSIIDNKSINVGNSPDVMQQNQSQNSSFGKSSIQKNKLNSPVLKSGSSSQRIPPSPKRIPPNSNESKNSTVFTKSQPKLAVSFLTDDDDDDDYAIEYDKIISHRMVSKANPNPDNSGGNENKSIQEEINLSRAKPDSFFQLSPKKSQTQAQSQFSPKPAQFSQLSPKPVQLSPKPVQFSQLSPKHVQLNQPTKNKQSFLSSSDSDVEYLDELEGISNLSSNNNKDNDNNQVTTTFSQQHISNSSFNNNNYDQQKTDSGLNHQPTLSNAGFSSNRDNLHKINSRIEPNPTNFKSNYNPVFQLSQRNSSSSNSSSKSSQNSQQKEAPKTITNGITNQPSTPKNAPIRIERFKSEKLVTPPSAFDHQEGQINRNHSLFELSMRQPSPPPPQSISSQAMKQSKDPINSNNTKKNESCIKTSIKEDKEDKEDKEVKEEKKVIISDSNHYQQQKPITVISDESNEPCQQQQQQTQQKPKIVKFLDDDDDFDDIDDFEGTTKPSNIIDASNFIKQMSIRKRRRVKSNDSKNKDSSCGANNQQKDVFVDDNSDSQYEIFTQRPIDNDNDGMPIVSYDEKEEPAKETILNDEEDPILSLFQK